MIQGASFKGFEKLEFLGEGTYGIVFKAKNTQTGEIVALKRIKLESQEEGIPSTTLREITILKQLSPHPNIIELKSVLYDSESNKLDLVFEYAEYDLKRYLNFKKDSLSKQEIKQLMFQLIRGIDYCHSQHVFHRDLKPQNILITKNKSLKIGDFGLARPFTAPIRTFTHEIETLWYRAPEILLGQRSYNLGVDVWAVGCIFAELIERKALLRGNSEIDQIFKIFSTFGTPTQQTWPELVSLPYFKKTFPKFEGQDLMEKTKNNSEQQLSLLLKMLKLNPNDRISMKDALKDPYFSSLNSLTLKKYQKI